jgi:hypothetical protein
VNPSANILGQERRPVLAGRTSTSQPHPNNPKLKTGNDELLHLPALVANARSVTLRDGRKPVEIERD